MSMETRLARTIRFPAEDLAEIDRRAHAYRMTRTRYLIDAALQQLPDTPDTQQRLEAVEQRLERLEQISY